MFFGNLKSKLTKIAVALAVSASAVSASAMDFRIEKLQKINMNIVVASGEIVEGDAERFMEIAPRADRDINGLVVLLLDSVGGLAKEAFLMAGAMDKVGVYTMIPPGGKCASVCATILYLSGTRRQIIGNGELGFHGCYLINTQTGATQPYPLCNKLIAKYAESRGVSGESINLFSHYKPDEMRWLGKETVCTMMPGMCKP